MGYAKDWTPEGRAGVDRRGAGAVAAVGSAAQVVAGSGAAVADRTGVRVRVVEQGGRGTRGGVAADGGQVAGPVRRVAAGWVGRRSAPGAATLDHGRAGRGRGGGHAGVDAGE